MSKLLKIAGVTAGKQASGIKVDELGRIELSRTVEPKRIIGNVLEPYAEDYKGPVSVFGLELYAINSERKSTRTSYCLPTPDGWLMYTDGALFRYDSKGSVIWEAEGRVGEASMGITAGLAVIHGGYVYTGTRNALVGGGFDYSIDKISYETGEVVLEGVALNTSVAPDLVYDANIDKLVAVILLKGAAGYALVYIDPETMEVELSSAEVLTSKLAAVFGAAGSEGMKTRYENGDLYVLAGVRGVATAKIDADIEVTVQNLVLKYSNSVTAEDGFVLNGDVYTNDRLTGETIFRNGKSIYTRETSIKVRALLKGGTAGNLALMVDGNKVLAFDKDNLVMSVEIPHEITITSIAGDSMGNIFVATDSGIYILGDTLQIKGYQLVV